MVEGQNPAPAAAPTAADPAAAPAAAPVKKKSSATTVIIIIVIVLVVLGVGGYFVSRWLARRAADKIAGGIIGAATGGSVSVNSDTGSATVSNGSGTTSVGTNTKWPSDMPSSVPELKTGTLLSATSDKANKSWAITANEVTQAEFIAYKALIESGGWTSTTSSSSGVDLVSYEKGTYDLMLVYDTSESGISITVTTKSE